jgi:hypothetical protein
LPRQGSRRGRAKALAVSSPTRRISSAALKDSVETGKVPADELLELYRGDWAGDLTRIYGEFQLLGDRTSDATRGFRAFDRGKHAGAVVVLELFLAAVGDHAAKLLVHFLDQRGWLGGGAAVGDRIGPKRLLPCVPGRHSTT